ncbi:MAG TPA: class I SAM-dependent methyltransferase [Candidatus Limnocylindrales bacterium]|nr:class I SAM-dependent methyltransferase [Candidatus Limnocylindrales bacterium]
MTAASRWDAAYRGEPPPWEIDRPQPVVERIAAADGFRGDVLDAGCGTGENALFLAARGLAVTGIDWSALATERARAKATDRGLDVRFEQADALSLDALGASFDSVLDCGLFHTFEDPERARYVVSLASVVRRRGVLHVLCFSDREPWSGGPRRVTQAEIRASFADGWTVRAIEPEIFATRIHDGGALAWHATIERVGIVNARPMGLKPGLDLDDIEGLLDRVEGPVRR